MSAHEQVVPDWDPASPEVLRDQAAAYDAMRSRCPVAYSERLGWSLFRHSDILQVIQNPETFSNAVSQHLNVPNGMDPPEREPPNNSKRRRSDSHSVCAAIQKHAAVLNSIIELS